MCVELYHPSCSFPHTYTLSQMTVGNVLAWVPTNLTRGQSSGALSEKRVGTKISPCNSA